MTGSSRRQPSNKLNTPAAPVRDALAVANN